MINLKKTEASKILVKMRDGRLCAVGYKVTGMGKSVKHFISAATIARGTNEGVTYLKSYDKDLKCNQGKKVLAKCDIMAYKAYSSQQEAINAVTAGVEPTEWDWKRNTNEAVITALRLLADTLEADEG